MKEFKRAQVIAKNLPTGSYAAGCPASYGGNGTTSDQCKKCERTR